MFNFNEMIHEERSRCLRTLPAFSGTVLSAGCAGSWYFDWFSQCTGHTGRHIGIELFSPRPSDLPPNVEWIVNSVEHMEAVTGDSVDLVFSGQNVEHISASSLAGFIVEANRVLHDGALMVVDSPNRGVTQHLGYAQPEHTLELTVDEATRLLELGGFEVLEVRGIWLVIDPATNMRMQMGSSAPHEMSVEERRAGASRAPAHSFIWWINARKRTRPDEAAVREFVDNLFFRFYSGFVDCRFNSLVGRRRWDWGSASVEVERADSGYALYGPYIPLAGGHYVATFSILPAETPSTNDFEIVLDVISAVGMATHGRRVLRRTDFAGGNGWAHFQVPFDLAAYTTQVEARCHVAGFDGRILGRADLLSLER